MTTTVDVVNQALQSFGSRTTVASLSEVSNEATQANIILNQLLLETLRKAPWNCATIFDNLNMITSAPGTAENPSAPTTRWVRGQPSPPWVYEYQYPVNCLRPLWIVPHVANNLGAIPIYPSGVVTGHTYMNNLGPVVPYKVALDSLFSCGAATVAAGGTGHAPGDIITLAAGPTTLAPIGSPAKLIVLAVAAGVITSVDVVTQIYGNSNKGGSYFSAQTNPVAQGTTTGVGVGATFNLSTWSQNDQRVILTNQAEATMAYLKIVTDPNVLDPLCLACWTSILASRLCWSLSGNKEIANSKAKEANEYILQARIADANEGLTVNDVTPDWIKVRGITSFNETATGFDWGPIFPMYS